MEPERERELDNDVLPYIGEADYEEFRRLIGESPGTYEEWLKRHKQEKSARESKGHEPRDINVRPQDFVQFCRERYQECSEQLLLRFAIEEAAKADKRVKGNTDDPDEF